MRSYAVDGVGPIDTHPLRQMEQPVPIPGERQIRVRVSVCGVCRTDLHLAEGDLAPKRHLVVPGHEVVGVVDLVGSGTTGRFKPGDRVGIAWLAQTCGTCRFCRAMKENLCLRPSFTGWDVDGGSSEYAVAFEEYAYALPSIYDDVAVAPLLCAGIIGYRALRRAELPAGGRLGIYGFGASAHLIAQVALAQGATVHVLTRSAAARALALDLGVASAGDAYESPPEPLDAAIVFAPVGDLVPVGLAALDRGGTLVLAGIHMSDVPKLNYERHLFEERGLRSVTANTREDGEEFLSIAGQMCLKVTTTRYPLDKASEALRDLAHDRVSGAAVLVNESSAR